MAHLNDPTEGGADSVGTADPGTFEEGGSLISRKNGEWQSMLLQRNARPTPERSFHTTKWVDEIRDHIMQHSVDADLYHELKQHQKEQFGGAA